MRRIKTFAGLSMLMMAAVSGMVSNQNQTQAAASYSCRSSQCPNNSTCEGDHWTKTGDCTITCYKESGTPGELVFSGSANCGTSGSDGSGGSAGGRWGGLQGYCAENWMWDSACHGPDDPYTP